jgi:hypothetical protein
MSDSEKIYPNKYSKQEVKHDEFSKIYLLNRDMTSLSINKTFYSSLRKSNGHFKQKIEEKVHQCSHDNLHNDINSIHNQNSSSYLNSYNSEKDIKMVDEDDKSNQDLISKITKIKKLRNKTKIKMPYEKLKKFYFENTLKNNSKLLLPGKVF